MFKYYSITVTLNNITFNNNIIIIIRSEHITIQ